MIHVNNKNQILHITPHLGGGVGKAISGILSYEKIHNPKVNHKIIILDTPDNFQFVDICQQNDIEVIFTKDLRAIEFEIKNSDITIMHWWHHPLNAWLLANFPQIPCRFVLWSHINGCTYPVLPFRLVEKVHKSFFTSRYTMFNPYWNENQQKFAQNHARVIYGLGRLEDLPFNYSFKKSDEFVIGYVGTLSFSKLNPDFVEYCYEVVKLIPNSKFVMVGNPNEKNKILSQAQKIGIEEKFEFVGYTNNVNEELAKFDVFGYPLNNWHFGTTENAILEAMNSTIPVVALNQCSERFLIEHDKTGYLANDKKHYAKIMKKLHDNLGHRIRISTNAKKMLNEKFLMEKNIRNMREALSSILIRDKREFDFKPIVGNQPHEWFLACLGTDKHAFENNDYEKIKNCREILKEENKSSVNHFTRYFRHDKMLLCWSNIIKRNKIVKL